VTVVSGGEHLSEKGTAETRVLQALRAEPDQRLACQTWARGDATIKY
jgi:ferredoxin